MFLLFLPPKPFSGAPLKGFIFLLPSAFTRLGRGSLPHAISYPYPRPGPVPQFLVRIPMKYYRGLTVPWPIVPEFYIERVTFRLNDLLTFAKHGDQLIEGRGRPARRGVGILLALRRALSLYFAKLRRRRVTPGGPLLPGSSWICRSHRDSCQRQESHGESRGRVAGLVRTHKTAPTRTCRPRRNLYRLQVYARAVYA